MTNRQKFKKVFGYEPDTTCVLPCPKWNIFTCPWKVGKGNNRNCKGHSWWDQEYDGHSMTPKGVPHD